MKNWLSAKKKIFSVISCIILILIIIYQILARVGYNPPQNFKLGMAFGIHQAEYLGLDWRKNYLALLDDLKIKNFRLPVYWNRVEKEKGVYDFSEIDWQLDELGKRGGEAILVLGRRVPRWPECHDPAWVKSISVEAAQIETLKLITVAINHFKTNPTIKMWQVENEPLLTLFGECPPPDKEFLKQEIALVRQLDGRRILITDSGELSLWWRTSVLGDYLGTTLYRKVHNPTLGFWSYWWLPASWYRMRARLMGKPLDKMLISELQAEPWQIKSLLDDSKETQFKTMNAERLLANVVYAKKTGFSKIYLWGGEWWYWLKEKMGDNSVWEAAREVFKN